MRALILVLGAVRWTATADARLGEMSYLGRGARSDTARVETPDRRIHELRKGDTLPEVGELENIDDDEVSFERPLSDEERDRLKAVGAAIPDVRRLRLRRMLD